MGRSLDGVTFREPGTVFTVPGSIFVERGRARGGGEGVRNNHLPPSLTRTVHRVFYELHFGRIIATTFLFTFKNTGGGLQRRKPAVAHACL